MFCVFWVLFLWCIAASVDAMTMASSVIVLSVASSVVVVVFGMYVVVRWVKYPIVVSVVPSASQV